MFGAASQMEEVIDHLIAVGIVQRKVTLSSSIERMRLLEIASRQHRGDPQYSVTSEIIHSFVKI